MSSSYIRDTGYLVVYLNLHEEMIIQGYEFNFWKVVDDDI
jgi:hypothetical protein